MPFRKFVLGVTGAGAGAGGLLLAKVMLTENRHAAVIL